MHMQLIRCGYAVCTQRKRSVYATQPYAVHLQRAILAQHDGPRAHEQHVAMAGSLRLRGVGLLQREAAKHEPRHDRTRQVGKPRGTVQSEAQTRELQTCMGSASRGFEPRMAYRTAFRSRSRGSCESTPRAARVAPEAARREVEVELASGQKSISAWVVGKTQR